MLWIINQIFFLSVLSIWFVLLLALFRASPNREYSKVTLLTTSGLYPKSSPVKYSYLSNSLDDNAEILAASLSRSC